MCVPLQMAPLHAAGAKARAAAKHNSSSRSLAGGRLCRRRRTMAAVCALRSEGQRAVNFFWIHTTPHTPRQAHRLALTRWRACSVAVLVNISEAHVLKARKGSEHTDTDSGNLGGAARALEGEADEGRGSSSGPLWTAGGGGGGAVLLHRSQHSFRAAWTTSAAPFAARQRHWRGRGAGSIGRGAAAMALQ
jgi:hypothetical protein